MMEDQSINSTAKPTNNNSISHSIIKSLHLFNTISRDDTKLINSKILGMSQWFQGLNDTITSTQSKTTVVSPSNREITTENLQDIKIVEDKNDQVPLSSPQRFETFLPDSNQNSIILDSETTGKQELFITANPSPIIQKTPQTAHTFNEHIYDSGLTNLPKVETNETAIRSNFETKISSWSPVKVENTLKNIQIPDDNDNDNSNSQSTVKLNDTKKDVPDTSNSIIVSKTDIRNTNDHQPSLTNIEKNNTEKESSSSDEKIITEGTTKENIKVENTDPIDTEVNDISKNNTVTNPVSHIIDKVIAGQPTMINHEKNKVTVRSNMFEPLPEKDPLIVKNSSPSQTVTSKSNNNTLKFQSLTKNVNLPTLTNSYALFKTTSSFSKKSLSPSLNNKYKSIITPKGKVNHNNTIHKIKSNTTSRVSPHMVNKVVSPLRKNINGNIIKKENIKTNKSPLLKLTAKTPQRTHITNSKPGAVFDRLSSIPTKSFEQKIRSKTGQTPRVRKFTPSSIDVTGSPIRRISPRLKKTNMSEILEQEALSSIFFKNKTHNRNSPLKQEKLASNNKKHMSPIGKILGSKLNNTNKVFESLIPKLVQETNVENVKQPFKDNSLISKPSISNDNTDTSVNDKGYPYKSGNSYGTKTLVDHPVITPLKNTSALSSDIQTSSNNSAALGKAKPTLVNSISLSSLNPNENFDSVKYNESVKVKQSLKSTFENIQEEKNLEKLNENPTNSETKAKDMTEKIQLIPLGDESKVDVKVKLNKRLSEVIRTQQEQEKKRKESQQKRKRSHLEDELRRKHSRYSTYRIYSKKNSLGTNTGTDPFVKATFNNKNLKTVNSGVTSMKNSNDNIIDTSNLLGDINKVDYRNVISDGSAIATNKAAQVSEFNAIGEDSLPEILSDDEQNGVVMAEWAQSPALENQLKIQQSWDPRRIFGPIKPIHIDEIFPTSSSSRFSKVKSRLMKKSSWKS